MSSDSDAVNWRRMNANTSIGREGIAGPDDGLDLVCQKVVSAYFSGQGQVVAVFLFGSRAAGRSRPGSDVDIALLFDHRLKAEQDFLLDRFSRELTRKLRKDLHLVVMNRAGEMLLKQILAKGICLCVNNPKALARFKIAALSRIFDYDVHHRHFVSGLKRRMAGEQIRARP